MKELSEKEALYKAAAYCSTAEHCTSEVQKKLTDWGVDETTASRILTYLTKEKYLDNQRFCRSFIREKLLYNKWGRIKIAQALWSKQIPTNLSAPLLEEIDDSEYEEILLRLLSSKRKSITGRNDYERNGKLIRFALSRGFEMDVILKHVRQPEIE